MPWYRNAEDPHYYHVASICTDLRPSSNFPDQEYGTFNDYFMDKYGMTIFMQHQPLLDVDYTSTRLNLLTPRQLPSRHSRSDRGPGGLRIINQRHILGPDLVDVPPIPSSMLILIVTLPSVLYRYARGTG